MVVRPLGSVKKATNDQWVLVCRVISCRDVTTTIRGAEEAVAMDIGRGEEEEERGREIFDQEITMDSGKGGGGGGVSSFILRAGSMVVIESEHTRPFRPSVCPFILYCIRVCKQAGSSVLLYESSDEPPPPLVAAHDTTRAVAPPPPPLLLGLCEEQITNSCIRACLITLATATATLGAAEYGRTQHAWIASIKRICLSLPALLIETEAADPYRWITTYIRTVTEEVAIAKESGGHQVAWARRHLCKWLEIYMVRTESSRATLLSGLVYQPWLAYISRYGRLLATVEEAIAADPLCMMYPPALCDMLEGSNLAPEDQPLPQGIPLHGMTQAKIDELRRRLAVRGNHQSAPPACQIAPHQFCMAYHLELDPSQIKDLMHLSPLIESSWTYLLRTRELLCLRDGTLKLNIYSAVDRVHRCALAFQAQLRPRCSSSIVLMHCSDHASHLSNQLQFTVLSLFRAMTFDWSSKRGMISDIWLLHPEDWSALEICWVLTRILGSLKSGGGGGGGEDDRGESGTGEEEEEEDNTDITLHLVIQTGYEHKVSPCVRRLFVSVTPLITLPRTLGFAGSIPIEQIQSSDLARILLLHQYDPHGTGYDFYRQFFVHPLAFAPQVARLLDESDGFGVSRITRVGTKVYLPRRGCLGRVHSWSLNDETASCSSSSKKSSSHKTAPPSSLLPPFRPPPPHILNVNLSNPFGFLQINTSAHGTLSVDLRLERVLIAEIIDPLALVWNGQTMPSHPMTATGILFLHEINSTAARTAVSASADCCEHLYICTLPPSSSLVS